MKNTAQHAEQLTSLISTITPPENPPTIADDPMHVLVESMLLWEAPTDKATQAIEKLMQETVDYNDLRVTMEHEFIDLLGARYPRIENRSARLRAVLRDIYLREHRMSLDSLRDTGKREVRKYIETLKGIPPFAAARVLLLSFETHTIPVDSRLASALASAGASREGLDETDLSSWLSRQIKASDGVATHFALQHWVDAGGGKSRRSRKKSPGSSRSSRTKEQSTKSESSTQTGA